MGLPILLLAGLLWSGTLPVCLAQESVSLRLVEGVPTELSAKLAWQIALEREGFSPGLIDGKIGGKTKIATTYFQAAHDLPKTGVLDEATLAELRPDPAMAFVSYSVVQSDLEGITPATKDWVAKSQMAKLGYFSVLDGLAEKFHTSQGMLKTLNPSVDFEALEVGTPLRVPGIAPAAATPKASYLTVDLPRKMILVMNAEDRVVALFHCSIAAKVEKRPAGETTVIANHPNPNYTFDPQYWPEVTDVDRKLIIPPGPRNPVGLCWIGLNLPGYGMHGTPWPEMIGKSGSHGCFRLANWDALRLSKMVKLGMTVKFVGD